MVVHPHQREAEDRDIGLAVGKRHVGDVAGDDMLVVCDKIERVHLERDRGGGVSTREWQVAGWQY